MPEAQRAMRLKGSQNQSYETQQRQGIPVARCTVEKIMRAHGWRGAMGPRKGRTTARDPAAGRAPDLVRRRFRASRPDALHVADFTYVPLDGGGGFGYTAFVIDAYAGLIVGWECSLTENTPFVERAIRAAAALRAREGHPLCGDTIHHSDYAGVCVKPRICGAGLHSWG